MQIRIGGINFTLIDFLHMWDCGHFNRTGSLRDVVEGLVVYLRAFEEEPDTIEEMKENINHLETDNDHLRGIIEAQDSEIDSLKDEIKEYTRKWDGVERRNQDLEDALCKIDSLENTIYTLENRIKEMEWMH